MTSLELDPERASRLAQEIDAQAAHFYPTSAPVVADLPGATVFLRAVYKAWQAYNNNRQRLGMLYGDSAQHFSAHTRAIIETNSNIAHGFNNLASKRNMTENP